MDRYAQNGQCLKKKKNSFLIALIIFAFCLTFPIVTLQSPGTTNEDRSNELPYCKPTVDTPSKSMIIVSTLDGQVTALDTVLGTVLWSLATDPGDLLQSTISDHEFINRGKWSRLVPSLNGDLFTFDGESMDAVPISADSLLSNSVKLFDDTVIIGGKEITIYGIKKDTGELVYSCGIEKCKYLDNVIQNSNDGMLLIRRFTRTVRGLSASSGTEKWNYSVGQHEVTVADPSSEEGCYEYGHNEESKKYLHENYLFNLTIRFTSSEGIVLMFNKYLSNDLVWKHQFSSPIIHAWNVTGQKVQVFDLFECKYNSRYFQNAENPDSPNPLLYIGLYEKQLYVMESKKLFESLPLEWRTFSVDMWSAPPRVQWKPYLITSHSRTPIIVGNAPNNDDYPVSHVNGDVKNTALAIGRNDLEYPFDNGFYLFPAQDIKVEPNVFNTTEDEGIDIIIVSLWYWWKEVLAISFTFAIAVNIIIIKCFRSRKQCIMEENHKIVLEAVDNKIDLPSVPKDLSSQNSSSNSSTMITPPIEFVSRYTTDFQQLETLGKGGFGVVFRVKNKIDDCEYAIKRIAMPKNRDSKDRILREVKTLAKLDHVGIVRYYNSWLECPPVDWQIAMDQNSNLNLLTPTASFTLDDLQLAYETRMEEKGDGNFNVSTQTSDISNLNNNDDLSSLKLRRPKVKSYIDRTEDLDETSSLDSGLLISNKPNEVSSDSYIVFECTNSKSNVETSELETEKSLKNMNTFNSEKFSRGISISNTKNEKDKLDTVNSGTVSSEVVEDKLTGFPPWIKATKTLLYIQMQLCRKASLKDWLSDNREARNRIEVLDIFYQIVSAVEYVHDQGLMHRDLKPSNIFFALDGSIKVGDFGLVTNMSQEAENEDMETSPSNSSQRHTNQVGTTLYMSPEQVSGDKYDHKVDVYSLGLVFFELLVPFCTAMERIKTMNDARLMKFSSSFIEDCPAEHDLVKLMLEPVPIQRPSATEILNNPLFEEFQIRPDRMRRRTRTMSRTFSISSSNSSQGSNVNDLNL